MDSEQIASIESRLSKLESEFARLRRHLLGERLRRKWSRNLSLAGRPAPELVFKKVIPVPVETPPWRTQRVLAGPDRDRPERAGGGVPVRLRGGPGLADPVDTGIPGA